MNDGPRTALTVHQLERLHADLHPHRVSNRDQGGRQLSYLEAYDVKATLVRIFGYGNFSVECLETRITYQDTYKGPNDRELWRVAAMATVRLTIHQTGAVYTETAAASQSGPDIGEVTDFAVKTAESDALKRTAIYLGTTFGLSLYQDGTTRDVVGYVFAPDQKDVIDDLNAARKDSPDSAGAKERLQARLKTHAAAGLPVAPATPAEPAAPRPAARRRKAAEPTPEPAAVAETPARELAVVS